MKTLKKLMALVLAGAMLSGVNVFAADGDTSVDDDTGAIDVEGDAGKITGAGDISSVDGGGVIRVVLPTASDASSFSFVLDPSRLISTSKDTTALVKDKTATLLFANKDAKDATKYTLSAKSDSITFTNKSMVPVNVELTVAKDADFGDSKITLVDGVDKFDGNAANVFLAVGTAAGETPFDGATLKLTSMLPDGMANFEIKQKQGGGTYEYEFVEKTTAKWESATAYLTGSCDAIYDWANDATIDASKAKIDYSWALTALDKTATTVNSTTVGDAGVDLTLAGLVAKADGVDGTASITFRNVNSSKVTAGTVKSTTVTQAKFSDYGTVTDGKFTLSKAGAAKLLTTYGTGTISVSGVGTGGAMIKLVG